MSLVGYAGDSSEYWRSHFIGQPMSEPWSLPPLKVLGKSKKLPDFVGWMFWVPVVSQRAMELLKPVVDGGVQFLRFHDLRGKPYYAMNVLRVEDYLDDARSVSSITQDGIRYNYRSHVFKDDLPESLPPIFKTRGSSLVFVTQSFVDVIIANNLTGVCLQDPKEDGISLAARGLPLNAYPGLP
ncbi:imm11 family protein [Dyella humicola]|uniref:imm11 family protein n=1 Tax=Dyella humicola TaxID=2992126 RepID=UPI0022505216|nr:DUF1629 domain-containing protein [Dyella humicola]